jgi:hypothetical protein
LKKLLKVLPVLPPPIRVEDEEAKEAVEDPRRELEPSLPPVVRRLGARLMEDVEGC